MKKITLIIPLTLIIFGCSKNPEKALQDAIAKYKMDDTKSISPIKEAFINKVSAGNFSSKGLQSNGKFLFYLYEESLKIIYPYEKILKPVKSNELTSFDLNQDFFTYCNGIQINAKNLKTGSVKNITLPDEKERIKSHILHNDSLIYYSDNKLLVDELLSDNSGLLVKDQLIPPYNKYFQAYLGKNKSIISLLLGVAGSYYLSIIDAETASVLVKNISLSSSKFYVDKNDAYYILGSTGSWEIMKFNIINKKKKSLKKFSNIIDIELCSFGLILENSDGLTIEDYESEEKIEIPFEYRLKGKVGDYILMEYSGKTYLVDLKSMYDNLDTLKTEIPELFK